MKLERLSGRGGFTSAGRPDAPRVRISRRHAAHACPAHERQQPIEVDAGAPRGVVNVVGMEVAERQQLASQGPEPPLCPGPFGRQGEGRGDSVPARLGEVPPRDAERRRMRVLEVVE